MRTCSSCGGVEDLHLVTIPYEPGPGAAGRVLLYCWTCRSTRGSLGVSIPVDIVTEAVFSWLYESGRTASAPDMAARIAFGEDKPQLAERLAGLIGQERP